MDRPSGSGKTEFSQDCLKTNDLMKKTSSSALHFGVAKTSYMRMLQTTKD
jgi:hypothetical protein